MVAEVVEGLSLAHGAALKEEKELLVVDDEGAAGRVLLRRARTAYLLDEPVDGVHFVALVGG